MLRTDLIELINGGGVWGFIGSGASIEAGCPSWSGLVNRVVDRLDQEAQDSICNDDLYKSALENEEYAKCFSRVEHFAGREALEDNVKREVSKVRSSGNVTRRLVEWPFAGYITTNYDALLEIALGETKQRVWTPVGNSPDEIRKVSGEATNVVWHVHGSARLPEDKSRLILTEEDYDDLYLEETPMMTQLRGLLAQRRLLFVGFGFQDPEILRLLKRVGRLTHPARPVYAFLTGFSRTRRKELLEQHNVDVIPYDVIDGSHEQLEGLLAVYGSMILSRSLRFGQRSRPCPSYDPETTGLLIYNELCLKAGASVSGEILEAILRARVLSLLRHYGPCSIDNLMQDLQARVFAIRGRSGLPSEVGDTIESVLLDLVKAAFVKVRETETGLRQVALSDEGANLAASQAATASRLSDQFSASLQARAGELFRGQPEASERIAAAAESFLKDCIELRALGVALARSAWRKEHQSYHMVALLQELPKFMSQLESRDEAIALTKLVQGVFSKPTGAEANYIGLALQAKFGVHLLGYDPPTLEARVRDLSQTLFLVDSSTLIPFLARSSVGHKSSALLIDRLKSIGSCVATTALLAQEVAEHARWAIKKVEPDLGRLGTESFKSATGRAGERTNAFLEGFIEELNLGMVPDFFHYFSQICESFTPGGSCEDKDIEGVLLKHGILCYGFEDWGGFTRELWHDREKLQHQIADLRIAKSTYKHERQVKAEAEALIVITNFRERKFRIEPQSVSNAYFISPTRVIDQVAGSTLAITMRPEAALHWVFAVQPCGVDELSFLTNSLLWELSEGGLAFVDASRIQEAFSPLINASKEKLGEVMERNRALISQKYGEHAAQAFGEVTNLEAPVVWDSYNAQIAEDLSKKLELEQKERMKAEAQARLSKKQLEELEILRMDKKQRQRKAKAKKQASGTRKRKKRRKKAR